MSGATIEFYFDDVDAESRFLESTLPSAWDEFESSEYWDHGWFWPYGQFAGTEAGPNGGFVRLVFDGDPATLVAAHRDRWEEFDGLSDWECRRYDDPTDVDETFESLRAQQRSAKGAVGGEREYQFKALTARLALEYHESVDEPLPATPEPSEDDPLGIGVWALCHDLLVQMGFDWYDETDAATRMLQNRLKSIAGYHGAEAAREEYDRIRAQWLDFENELESWLEANETGHLSEP